MRLPCVSYSLSISSSLVFNFLIKRRVAEVAGEIKNRLAKLSQADSSSVSSGPNSVTAAFMAARNSSSLCGWRAVPRIANSLGTRRCCARR